MKRLMTATAIATLAATGAMAQTAEEVSTIEQYLPRVMAETLTDQQVEQLMLIAHGSDSISEKEAGMRALVTESNMRPVEPMEVDVEATEGLTEAERVTLQRYAPELDVSTLTQEEIVRLQLVINSGDTSEIEAVVDSIENG